MFKPGDVVALHSDVAGKRKFHLCVSLKGCYLFLNSPKARTYPGDLVIDCDELPFLEPTATGKSIVSCSIVLFVPEAVARKARAEKLGEVSQDLMMRVLAHVEGSEVLSERDREAVLSGLGDYF